MKRVACWFLVVVAVLGLFAPVIGNDLPLIAVVDGAVVSPALGEVLRTPLPPPDRDGVPSASWKQWWALLPEASADWAVMPLWPYGPNETGLGPSLDGPSLVHPFGLDDGGRDVLARVLHALQLSLWVGLGTAVLALLLGVPLGALAGMAPRVDPFVRVALEMVAAVPALLLAFAATALLGASAATLVLVLGVLSAVGVARVVRAQARSIVAAPFVAAARGLGIGPIALFLRHVWPSLRGPAAIAAVLAAAGAVVVEATLSFLGLGVGLQTPSLGAMVADGRQHAAAGVWHVWAVPGAVVVAIVVALHAAADRATGGETSPR